MKKIQNVLLIALVIILLIALVLCYESSVSIGYNISFYNNQNPENNNDIYTAIYMNKSRYNINEEVPVTFSYGHMLDNKSTEDSTYKNYRFKVYLKCENHDDVILEEVKLSDIDFYNEMYKCYPVGFIDKKLKFTYSKTLNIDFSDYKSGEIIIGLFDESGENVSYQKIIYFNQEYNKIQFTIK